MLCLAMHATKAEYIQVSNCNKAEYISDDVGNHGILKIICHLKQKDYDPAFACIGKRQVHKTQMKKMTQIIVPGKCTVLANNVLAA